jgi:hypothetical protein
LTFGKILAFAGNTGVKNSNGDGLWMHGWSNLYLIKMAERIEKVEKTQDLVMALKASLQKTKIGTKR